MPTTGSSFCSKALSLIFYLLPLFLLLAPLSAWSKTTYEARNKEYLTVCGDPNHMPFSNKKLEGFENRIAKLIADDLNRTLRYHWWPQTIGFVRNTLSIRLCDLVMGVTSVNELLQNTNPYYRSVYTLVYRKDSGLALRTLDAAKLNDLKIGVVAGTPPATLLSKYGLLDQVRPYQRTVDTRLYSPATRAVEDVADGTIDVAVIWGPIAGYVASRQETPLSVIPLPAKVDSVPLAFNVSMGIRRRESNWKHQLNLELEKLSPNIEKILLEYNIPLLDRDDRLIQH
ncbi:MAG: substrate-binding domain-containing protein [Candidatus Thiodiazotropha sp. (ex. Lucinisca nassula)]|nr:substrate-binding domain-containing protein [Candidatus Thiodiazotropha sp. (ex. Lucinisca nassula)]MBW9272411.1 substrate-binding domain-containing protein [Candidatus Thiodiazotropha sp. (ex. Lucinisca nassula)]PUB82542.1 MAG: quinoprotein dehydrogenase-associated putative ABC transporter substrate-binding protein [gamma proteobacterium symbiont of Ctena orbiculata]PUB91759.1 MAG: quinoprotein dehydrogenase-associated putative ABC transporter substrate-binding protein [gamma proteobacterium